MEAVNEDMEAVGEVIGAVDEDMAVVDAAGLRARFHLFFSVKPDLTPEDLAEILQSSEWNERVALRKVYELKNGRDITVPQCPSQTPTLDFDSQSTPSTPDSEGCEDASVASDILPDDLTPIITSDDSTSDEFQEFEEETATCDAGPLLHGSGRNPPRVRTVRQQNPVSALTGDHTTVTKWIRKLVGGLYINTLVVCNNTPRRRGLADSYVEKGKLDGLIDVTYNREKVWEQGWAGRDYTENIELVRPVKWQDRLLRRRGYGAAFIDKDRFIPGDYVTVCPGTDGVDTLKANKQTATNIKNAAANIWFARIVYIFSNMHGDEMVHVRWFFHGGDTFLRETAGPKELFLVDRCDDIYMTSIVGKIEVERCTRSGPSEAKDRFKKVNFYFYRFFYDVRTYPAKFADEKFEDAAFHEENFECADPEKSPVCYCCAKRKQRLFDNAMRVTGQISRDHSTTDFSYNGVEYKLHDCVYIFPRRLDEPHAIGQITDIKCIGHFNWKVKDPTKIQTSVQEILLTIQYFRRFDDFNSDYFLDFKRGDAHSVRDSRRLYLTNMYEEIVVDSRLGTLLGKCHVVHTGRIKNLTKYKNLEDTFHVGDRVSKFAIPSETDGTFSLRDIKPLKAKEFIDSSDGNEMVLIEEKRKEVFSRAGLKLRAMDVFAGCGGLTSGLHESGAVETLFGIEYDKDASQTLRRNFPHMKVYNQSANILLQRAIQEEQGTVLNAMKDLQGNLMPPMPRRGEIEFLYGGPPCQDFSMCNRHRKEKSSKNSLITTFLSYVDHYRPKYFLLENVRGLLQHRLGSSQRTKHTLKGAIIEQGSVKVILRALTSLGYSAQYKILQASEHGAPQSRRRVFFWGCSLGLRLPLYPQPTHICKGLSIPTDTFVIGKTAPHNPVTVGDAISDLPAFEWKITEPGCSRQPLLQRGSRIPMVAVHKNKDGAIGDNNQTYAYGPITDFQREIRRHVAGNIVKNHFTRYWGLVKMTRISRIPMKPGANHNDLDTKHDVKHLRKGQAAAKKKYYPFHYYRLDYNEHFQTCLTNIEPSGQNGKILHPTQRRILTVREFARAQGFLDTFTWDPNNQSPKAMYKQIGNAVSLQVGRALGKELFKVLYAQWESANATDIPGESQPEDLEDDGQVEDEFEGFSDIFEVGDASLHDYDTLNDPIVISDSE